MHKDHDSRVSRSSDDRCRLDRQVREWLLEAGPEGLVERAALLYEAGDPPPDEDDALAHVDPNVCPYTVLQ
jgi:hypothetical protein